MRPQPNPSLHLTFHSRLRRLLPAGELQRYVACLLSAKIRESRGHFDDANNARPA